MQLKLWQIDAFAGKPLEGNPAAVVPLEAWLDPGLMQKIAGENNLAETAFFVRTAPGRYDLRWFTPVSEMDLCGHATLASAWLIFGKLEPGLETITFTTRSGELIVARGADGRHVMSLPSDMPKPLADDLAGAIGEALGVAPPRELLRARYLMGVWDEAPTVRAIKGCGNIAAVLRRVQQWGFIATAKGDGDYDFVSRFFAPDNGIPEDPVTGSAHCILTPYWAKELAKKSLRARQVSPRGGDLFCQDEGSRIALSGPCALYLEGEISVRFVV
jgi:PhzF family phenazine biosynthesis protein